MALRISPSYASCNECRLFRQFCLAYWLLTSWELNFVATVARYTKPPSAKQLIILQRLVVRCRNAA